MGLIIIIVWLGALGVLGVPGLGVSIVVCVRSRRNRAFWVTYVGAVVASVLGQYVAVLTPFVRRGVYSWDLVVAAVFGWHLLAPAIIAVALWIAARTLRQSSVAGAAAGLFLSIPVAIALALPILFTIPPLLGLRFEP
jgi:hypothetical protein